MDLIYDGSVVSLISSAREWSGVSIHDALIVHKNKSAKLGPWK